MLNKNQKEKLEEYLESLADEAYGAVRSKEILNLMDSDVFKKEAENDDELPQNRLIDGLNLHPDKPNKYLNKNDDLTEAGWKTYRKVMAESFEYFEENIDQEVEKLAEKLEAFVWKEIRYRCLHDGVASAVSKKQKYFTPKLQKYVEKKVTKVLKLLK